MKQHFRKNYVGNTTPKSEKAVENTTRTYWVFSKMQELTEKEMNYSL